MAHGTGVFTINDSTSQNCYDSTAATLFTPGSVGGAPGPPPPPACTPATIDAEDAETYAFVIVQPHQAIRFIQTDNSGGGAKIFLYGQATKQSRKEKETD